ncbi:MAG: branched-chain amino acid ABC transporter permease [Acidimicrobiia bacterium]
MSLLLIAVIAGIVNGAMYAIVGVGYTVIFSATRVFNLAQGDLLMVGIMSTYYVLDVLKWPVLSAMILVPLFVSVVAMIEERTVVRVFLQKQGNASFGWFIATLGFSLAVQTIVNVSFGRHPIVGIPGLFKLGGFEFGNVIIGYRQLFVVVSFSIIIALLGMFYKRTWMGQAMQATAEDRDAGSLLGINPITMSRTAFAMSGLIAGFAGFAISPITLSDPTVGLALTLKGFLSLAIGGFGSIRGAIVGGLLLGIGEQLWTKYWGSTYEALTGVVIVLLVLSFRPLGLFKSSAARTV